MKMLVLGVILKKFKFKGDKLKKKKRFYYYLLGGGGGDGDEFEVLVVVDLRGMGMVDVVLK